jgi:hypothetical protein
MMDPTKWLRLYEIEPELRPVTITGKYHLVYWREPDSEWWGWRHKDEMFKDDPPLGEDVVDPSCVAAMIRDKAVWWLADRGVRPMLATRQPESRKMLYVVVLHEINGGTTTWYESPDPTEALRLACCSVLGVTP